MRRKRYSEYKESGVEWLGEIPQDWAAIKLKYLTTKIGSGKTPKGGAKVYIESGIPFLRSQNIHFDGLRTEDIVYIDSAIDLEMHTTRVLPQDVLLTITGASLGRSSITPAGFGPANVNQHVCIIRPSNNQVNPRFLWRAICSANVQCQIFSNETGSSREGLNFQQVGDLVTSLPRELNEQRAIADFLDRETSRIDALIEKKNRQIELLEEKRAALISRAVTKGLNPDAKMKDTGVVWLGEIPENWVMIRLKYLSVLQTGLTLGKKYNDKDLATRPYLRVANVQDGFLNLDTITEVNLPSEDAPRYELQPGDVLMTEGGDFDKLGRGFIWSGQIPGCLHQNHIFSVRPKINLLKPHFLAGVLTSDHGKHYFTSTSQQTTNLASTNSYKIINFPVPLPPLPEQQNIIHLVRKIAERHQSILSLIQNSIATLQEYRSALITASVTGQIDIRNESNV